jgi:hypothetical protein
MSEEKVLLGIDFATASQLLIEIMLEEGVEPEVYKEIADANKHRSEILTMLFEHPSTPDEVRAQLSQVLRAPVKERAPQDKVRKTQEQHEQTILQRVQNLTVSEKLILALRGGREIRTILLRDPNKEIVMNVLNNPKLTETEVEMIAKSRSVSEEVLRKIAKKREWMKIYGVILSLVTNPKTPAGIALKLVNALRTKDLTLLEKNKNVAEGVRSMAKKLVRARKAH